MDIAQNMPEKAVAAYKEIFGGSPYAVCRAPGRVNLIGEHTDYNGGWVFPFAIERSTYFAFTPQSEPQLDIFALDLRHQISCGLPDGAKAARDQRLDYPDWLRYGAGVAWVMGRRDIPIRGLRGVLCSDIPMASGLSSSAAMEAAFALAFLAAADQTMPGMAIAQICQEAEHAFAGVHCGIMDQFACLLGRKDHALLLDCRSLEWKEIPVPHEAAFVIAHTRADRKLETSAYNERREQCQQAVRVLARHYPDVHSLRDATVEMLEACQTQLPLVVFQRAMHVVGECGRTLRAAEALQRNDLQTLGWLMNESHESLDQLYEVSGPELNAMVSIAQDSLDCLGSRLTGAGFGGCTIQLIDKDNAEEFSGILAEKYRTQTGLDPMIFTCTASAGACIL
jgi:galactokinase